MFNINTLYLYSILLFTNITKLYRIIDSYKFKYVNSQNFYSKCRRIHLNYTIFIAHLRNIEYIL